MASYVKFNLEDGTIVYIESTDTPRGSGSLIPRSSAELVEHAESSFEKSVESVRKMAAAMMDQFHSGFQEDPSEIAVSFGLKASADLGNLVVARTGGEGNFNVSLRWRKEMPGENDQDDKKEKKD